LFYPADASEDTQFMNRLERGAYFDLVKSQRLFHGFTVVQLRKILGKDFDEVWPSIELILKCEGEEYFIRWVRESIVKREEYSKKQSDRVYKRYNHGNTVDVPKIENEIGIGDEDTTGDEKPKTKTVAERIEDFKVKLNEINHGFTESQLKNFITYWTAMNPGDHKMAFELEKKFYFSRRIATWKTNDKKFSKQVDKTEEQKYIDSITYTGMTADQIIDQKRRDAGIIK